MFFNFDERRKIAVLPSEELIPFIADHFFDLFEHCVKTKGSFHVALAGGSTPKELYTYLADHPLALQSDWQKLFLYWGDERAVPAENPDSNYRMAMEAGFKKLNIPSSHIFRMPADLDLTTGASEYEELLKKNKLDREGFDLILLGMGEDGHTASLFPGTKALTEKNRLVVANEVPDKKCSRMTLTFPFINKSQNIIMLVKGASKKEMISRVFSEEGEKFPSFYIGTQTHKALWALDTLAAALLLKNL